MELHIGKLARLFVYALLGAAAFSVAAPLALMILNSLRSNFDILISPLGWPSEPEWGVFARVWKEAQLGQAIVNSLVIAAATVAIVCTISSMAAWVIARRTVPGWMTVSLYFLATTTVPIQMFMFPLYFMMAKLGLINSPVAVIIIYSAIFTPFSLFLLRTYVLDVPMELEEAARIDGASDWQVFMKVIVPLISPGLLTVALIVVPERVERVPDRDHVPAECRRCDGDGALLPAHRPLREQPRRPDGGGDHHRAADAGVLRARAAPLHRRRLGRRREGVTATTAPDTAGSARRRDC